MCFHHPHVLPSSSTCASIILNFQHVACASIILNLCFHHPQLVLPSSSTSNMLHVLPSSSLLPSSSTCASIILNLCFHHPQLPTCCMCFHHPQLPTTAITTPSVAGVLQESKGAGGRCVVLRKAAGGGFAGGAARAAGDGRAGCVTLVHSRVCCTTCYDLGPGQPWLSGMLGWGLGHLGQDLRRPLPHAHSPCVEGSSSW